MYGRANPDAHQLSRLRTLKVECAREVSQDALWRFRSGDPNANAGGHQPNTSARASFGAQLRVGSWTKPRETVSTMRRGSSLR